MKPGPPNLYQPPIEAEPMSAPPLEDAPFSGRRLVLGMGVLAVLWWSLWAAASWSPRWWLLGLVASFVANEVTNPSPWKRVLVDHSPKMIIGMVVVGIIVVAWFVAFYFMLPNMEPANFVRYLKLPEVVVGLWLVSCIWMTAKWWRCRSNARHQPEE